MTDRYPIMPGAKGADGTSQDAAIAFQPCASRLRLAALKWLARLGEGAPLEVVEKSGIARESLQPRFSELRRLGLVEPTGERHTNPSGKSAAVLRLTPAGWEALKNV